MNVFRFCSVNVMFILGNNALLLRKERKTKKNDA